MVKLLKGSEMLTVVDGAMLYNYCCLHGDAEEIKAELRALKRRKGRATGSDRLEVSKLMQRFLSQVRQYRQAIRMYLVEFGLSPSSRNRVDLSPGGAGAEDAGDELSEFDEVPPLRLVQRKTKA